jgi:hypothetical protein
MHGHPCNGAARDYVHVARWLAFADEPLAGQDAATFPCGVEGGDRRGIQPWEGILSLDELIRGPRSGWPSAAGRASRHLEDPSVRMQLAS